MPVGVLHALLLYKAHAAKRSSQYVVGSLSSIGTRSYPSPVDLDYSQLWLIYPLAGGTCMENLGLEAEECDGNPVGDERKCWMPRTDPKNQAVGACKPRPPTPCPNLCNSVQLEI